MRILVTGGAGYIGSAVVQRLVETENEVLVLDNLSQGYRAAVPEAATFVRGNVKDRSLVNRILADLQPEAIMHFASHTLVGESMEKPFLYLDDNVRGGHVDARRRGPRRGSIYSFFNRKSLWEP